MIVIQVIGAHEAMARLNKITHGLEHPKEGLIRSTHKVADIFGKNFDEEGSAVGGWAELSEQTVAMREYQGYPGEHPILFRYGALRGMAVEFFQKTAGGSSSAGDDYSNNVVQASLEVDDQRAVLSIGGSYKVLNQTGHPNARWGDNPARPFWFIDTDTIVGARDAMVDWIKDEVLP